jgi:hypothetical protein
MLEQALKYMFPSIDFIGDVILQDDGNGAYIAYWGLDVPQPTQAELEAAYSDWRAKMDAKEAAQKALNVTDRMRAIVEQGFAFMGELSEGQTNEVYQFNLSRMISSNAIAQMPISLSIIQGALAQVAAQCPDLAQEIFTSEQLAVLASE